MISTVGFIGLGAMGAPMASNLLRRGFGLVVHDVRPAAMEALLAQGARAAGSPRAVAGGSDVVITMLPGAPQVEAVLLGPEGVVEGLRPGQIVIDMSTVNPDVTRRAGERIAECGGRLIDAPVARTREAAVDGTLSIMVGGDRATFEEVRELLEAMGTDMAYCGGLGAGETVKLVNNLVLFGTVAALVEGLALGVKAGVDAATLVEVLERGSADSFALRNHVRKSVLAGDFAPGRFSVDYALKDMREALQLAESLAVPMPQLSAAKMLYEMSRAAGCGREYHPAVCKVIERFAGVEVRPRAYPLSGRKI